MAGWRGLEFMVESERSVGITASSCTSWFSIEWMRVICTTQQYVPCMKTSSYVIKQECRYVLVAYQRGEDLLDGVHEHGVGVSGCSNSLGISRHVTRLALHTSICTCAYDASFIPDRIAGTHTAFPCCREHSRRASTQSTHMYASADKERVLAWWSSIEP